MKNNALYFPTIAVSNNEWLTQVLLYWDKLFSILPMDYSFGPHPNDLFTRRLLDTGLLTALRPGLQLLGYRNFKREFMEFVRKRKGPMRRRLRTLFVERQRRIPVHAEKMEEIGEELVALGLAEYRQDFWYEVDPWVAMHFMTFLAVGLGHVPDLDAAPLTDNKECLDILRTRPPRHKQAMREPRLITRNAILAEILPVPSGTINLEELARFKRDQGERLKAFRAMVERECIEIANIADAEGRQDRLEIGIEALRGERQRIDQVMRQRWPNIIFGAFASLLWAVVPIAGVPLLGQGAAYAGAGAGFVNAVYQAFRSGQEYRDTINSPLAYAAFFARRFE